MNQIADKNLSDGMGHDAEARLARQVLNAEASAVSRIVIGPAFHDAARLIATRTGHEHHSQPDARAQGSLVVTGMGKSGLIGQKLSATFASTGTPSHFLHPSEAMHGDLGRIRRGDVVLALSYGGSTEEVVTLASLLRQDNVEVISITGRAESELGRLSNVALAVGDVTEACPLGLAPTTSTTAMLALGDALALCVSARRQFGVEDFHKFHPGGALGKQLLPVTEAMRFKAGANLPLIDPTWTIEKAYAEAEAWSSKPGNPGGRRAGALLIVDADRKLAGIFTDGDLRRTFIRHGSDAYRHPIGRYMTAQPRRLADSALVRDAVHLVREFRIDEVPVVDGAGRAIGLIDVQDLVALKVIEG